MKELLEKLVTQREKLQEELIKINSREYGDERPIIKALELNNELILKLINKPVETTNEQPTLYACDVYGNFEGIYTKDMLKTVIQRWADDEFDGNYTEARNHVTFKKVILNKI